MRQSSATTLPPGGSGSLPEVEDLVRADGTVLRPGSWKKPEIRLVGLKDRSVVIKDWRGIARWMRPWARLMCRREERIYHTLADDRLNHRPDVKSGVLAEPASQLLSDFFRKQREQHAK